MASTSGEHMHAKSKKGVPNHDFALLREMTLWWTPTSKVLVCKN